MATELVTKDDLVRSLDGLPAESLAEVRRYIDFLRFKTQTRPRRLIKLGGLWKDWPPITDEDIVQARQEAWGKFGERVL